ncbi:hypothetical protein [Marinoscillum sp.]|uniref:hypothetical protein n=1 Tax=Marinoscillum sp. TaxID=2024838 RepID=UPI003BAA9933
MKTFLILLLLISADPTEIARINRLKNKAEVAFEHGQYDVAATNYRILYDSIGLDDPSVGLNLAHSYYALGDTANAKLKYQSVASSNDKKLKSIAYQQLGVMAKSPSTLSESLQYLKAALKANPMNEEARYNYEVVKKLLDKQKEQQQDQDQQNQDENKDQEKNQDQENKDDQKEDQESQEQKDQEQQQEDQEQKDAEQKDDQKGDEEKEQEKEGEQKEEEKDQQNQNPSTKQKLEDMNISEEKARMILEAMKNNEIQYIQQQKRKATEQPDSGKPDW